MTTPSRSPRRLSPRRLSLRAPLATLAACAVLLGGAGAGQARTHHGTGRSGEPVVVELYTAQGCATCPKANGVVADLAAKRGVLPLTFSVDYWDYLGWEDTLAKPEFDARQRAYVQRLRVREIYTPEIVVAGATESPALDGGKIDGLIARAAHAHRTALRLKLMRRGVKVFGAGPVGDVWLIRYDPQPQSVKIKSGENRGQTVVVRNAVRQLKKLGPWRGQAKTYAIPKAEDAGLKTVVMVQAPRGGRILAVARG